MQIPQKTTMETVVNDFSQDVIIGMPANVFCASVCLIFIFFIYMFVSDTIFEEKTLNGRRLFKIQFSGISKMT